MMVCPVSSSERTRRSGLPRELGERDAHLLLVTFVFGLDGERNDGFGEDDGFEQDRALLVAEGVAGEGGLQTDARGDVAGVDLVDFLALVGVQADDASETLAFAGGGVDDVGARLDGAGVDAEEAELADERVGRDLEGQRRERLVVVGLDQDFLGRIVDVMRLERRNVERARQVVRRRHRASAGRPCS